MSKKTVKYTSWSPFKEMIGDYQITDFTHTFESLIINLTKNKSEKIVYLCVTFYGRDVICRVMNETYRGVLASYNDIVIPCGPLFKGEHSDYMQSLSKESYGLIDMLDFRHYLIDDSEWTFDVASQYQPQIELFIDGKLTETLKAIHHSDLNEK